MLAAADIEALAQARHADPFAVLGRHADGAGKHWLRVFLPGAVAVAAVFEDRQRAVKLPARADGLFEARVTSAAAYQLKVTWADGQVSVQDDPYRFPPVLGELDAWLLAGGTHLRPFEVLGAQPRQMLGVDGVAFAVWAPNASRASVVADFNSWDGRRHPMRLRRECGVWEIFIPGVGLGARYKFELLDAGGKLLPQKADPMARAAELRPATASIVAALPPVQPQRVQHHRANAHDAPISIYEVHLASWKRKPEDGDRWLTWDELADDLVPYAAGMGFTHLELMPITEHPFDGSWGYQTLGLYAPTARFGPPEGLQRFVQRAHDAGLSVILDWVPAHFPTDAHGLAQFDGTHLYEYADPREGYHNDWNTLIYNFGRNEVRSFLIGSALYWLERFGIDGLRVDAVASMLYRDYSRKAGEWIPNAHGGRENLEAISLLQRINEVVGGERVTAATFAEESTAFPGVSRPTFAGGLGFHYKWNMGWMHDTLSYLAREPIHRQHHHHEMSFGLVYAWSENFVLPLSHDEVVHGKGSLLAKMPGDRWQQLANLRAYFAFMFGHPGKKLLFMGCEFAQEQEWSHERSLDWHLLAQPGHAGMQRLVRDLNGLLKRTGALHELDASPEGFEWVSHDDAAHSVLAFVRKGRAQDSRLLVVCNFTPVVRHGWRVGVPRGGRWAERINTDSQYYGGSNVGAELGAVQSEPQAWHGRADSVVLNLPPLACLMLEWIA